MGVCDTTLPFCLRSVSQKWKMHYVLGNNSRLGGPYFPHAVWGISSCLAFTLCLVACTALIPSLTLCGCYPAPLEWMADRRQIDLCARLISVQHWDTQNFTQFPHAKQRANTNPSSCDGPVLLHRLNRAMDIYTANKYRCCSVLAAQEVVPSPSLLWLPCSVLCKCIVCRTFICIAVAQRQ